MKICTFKKSYCDSLSNYKKKNPSTAEKIELYLKSLFKEFSFCYLNCWTYFLPVSQVVSISVLELVFIFSLISKNQPLADKFTKKLTIQSLKCLNFIRQEHVLIYVKQVKLDMTWYHIDQQAE